MEQKYEIWQKGYFGNLGHTNTEGILVIAPHATCQKFSDPNLLATMPRVENSAIQKNNNKIIKNQKNKNKKLDFFFPINRF